MSTLSILLPFWLVWAAAVITPGPNFFAVSHMAAAHGRRAGLLTAAGVALGACFWAATGLFGLKLVFAVFPWAWTVAKIAGAVYLTYVGIQIWRSAAAPHRERAISGVRAFRTGLLTNLANPKTAAFAASLFAVALPAGASPVLTASAFVLIVLTVLIWYSLCAVFASRGSIGVLYHRYKAVLMRVAGALFVGFGLKLALDR